MVEEYYDRIRRGEIRNRVRVPRVSWTDYNAARNRPTMEPSEYIARVMEVAKINLPIAAIFSVLYLTGSRVGEVSRYKYDGDKEIERDLENRMYKPSMQVKDITIENDYEHNVTWLVLRTRVEKKREKKEVYRLSYILYDKTYPDGTYNYLYPLIEILQSYLDQYFDNAPDEVELFPKASYSVWANVKRYLPVSPHNIRGMRAKHLLRYHNFDVPALMEFFKWTDATIAVDYASSEMSDIKKKLLGIGYN